ncbi:MAG: acyl-CoA dehydrogenase family protein, partial [Nitrososphaerota archaeon]
NVLYLLLEPEHKYPRCFCTDEELLIAKSIREFTEKEVFPRRQDLEGGWHRDEELAHRTLYELYYKCHKLGLTTANLPVEYGGGGFSPVVRQMINEELSRGDPGLSTLVGKIHWIVSIMFNRVHARRDLLEEFSPKLTGKVPYIACVCITEPEGGANIEDPSLEFRTLNVVIAKKQGDSYILNGHKIWPGPAAKPEYWDKWREKWPEIFAGHLGYWIIVSEDPSRGEEAAGIVYVPYNAKGMSFGEPYKKCGFCLTDENVDMWFENVEVPAKYRIDTKPGDGAKIIKGYIVGLGRLAGAARLTGISTAVLEIALEWTKDREIAGKPVRERSLFASILAQMYRMIDLARQYYLSVTWQASRPDVYGEPWQPHMIAKFSSARSFAGEAAMFCTNKAMELMGSYGYSFEMNVEKYYRDFKIIQMWLGGAQRDLLDIAQGLYGPFKWGGYEEWLSRRIHRKANLIEKTTDKMLSEAAGESEAKKIKKELERDRDYDLDEALKKK